MTRIKRTHGTFNESTGNFCSWKSIDHGFEFITNNARILISAYSSEIIRFRISKLNQEFTGFSYAVIEKPLAETSFTLTESETAFELKTSALRVHLSKDPMRISIFDAAGNLLSQDDQAFGTSWLANEVTTYKKLFDNERFIGLGEKTGNLDRRGKVYVNWNTDHFAYDTDADPIYLSTPFYMGLHGKNVYGIFFDNSHKTTFSFGCSNNRFSYFQAEDGEMNYYFIHGSGPAKIIENYTWLTGRIEMPPLWSLGFQQCRYSYYPFHEVLTAARTFREKNIPADVLYLDIHYMQAYKVFTWHNERFPDPKGLMEELKAMGFKVVVILDPGVKKEVGYHAYDEGKEKDLFVSYPDGEEYNGQVWPGWSAFPDFTLDEARKWWGEKMHSLTDVGIAGFWNDMNEPAAWGQHLPDLIEFNYEGEGGTHKKSRNVYGMQMARATQEGAKNLLNGKRPFILTRAGYSGIQRHAAVWTGDNVSHDEHMLAGVRLVNSMGLTGVPFAGYDVGGFAGEASPELFARWISLGAFSPFFRSHSMVNSRDSEPWSFGEEVEDISRNYISLRYRLMPYLYSVFFESSKTGMPVSRSLAISNPFDAEVYRDPYQNQYLFGPSILVIPVKSNTNFHRAWFPEGQWYEMYTDKLQAGNKEEVLDYTKELLPLFVKAGSLLLMQKTMQHLDNANEAETLEVHVYVGVDGSFDYYEDDGDTYAFQQGASVERKFSILGNSLEVSAAQGGYLSRYKHWNIYFHGVKPESVKVNGAAVSTETSNYRFVEPVSDFDPYHVPPKDPVQIAGIRSVIVKATHEALKIEW